jgi:aminoglycoside phosphotransferase
MINYANWAREFKKRQKSIHTIMDKPLRELHDLTNRKCVCISQAVKYMKKAKAF